MGDRRCERAQQAVTAARDALHAATAELASLQQRLQAACAALASIPPGVEQRAPAQQPPHSTTGSRKRRVIVSDSDEDDDGIRDGAAGGHACMRDGSDEDRAARREATGSVASWTRGAARRVKAGEGRRCRSWVEAVWMRWKGRWNTRRSACRCSTCGRPACMQTEQRTTHDY